MTPLITEEFESYIEQTKCYICRGELCYRDSHYTGK